MKPAKLLCIASAALFASVASGYCQQPGRFQIVTGTFQVLYKGEEKVILKIDTATGETWKYVAPPLNFTGRNMTLVELQDAIRVDGWIKLSDDAMTDAANLERQARPAKTAAQPQAKP